MVIDINKLQSLVKERYLSVDYNGDLSLWNYTAKTQYEKYWTPETLMCRGLITDKDGNIVARPFPKFFNLSEMGPEWQPPQEPFEVTEKWDGSLVTYSLYEGNEVIATRGIWNNEQANKAREILHNKYGDIYPYPGYTACFEVIYRSNRIVCDYGDMEDVVLLSLINNETGKDFWESKDFYDIYFAYGYDRFKTAHKYDGINDINQLSYMSEDNKEGFVIRFLESNLRLKIKFDEYVRLHRLVTQVNAKTIWELLRANQDFDELLDRVPDEYYDWVTQTRNDLRKSFYEIEDICRHCFETRPLTPNRKEIAEYFKQCEYPHILFAMLDNQPYDDMIWKLLRPEATKPYKIEV